ncbi:MAG TPA: hypothetical protein DCS93_37105 [Microscillaceae bacterium]|nr:hypothetical protein [Microscillaceae bacterium]
MESIQWSSFPLLLICIIGIGLMIAIYKKIKSQISKGIYALLFIFWLMLLPLVHWASELELTQQYTYFIILGYLHAPFFYFNIRAILRLPLLPVRTIYYHFIPLQLYIGILMVQAIKGTDGLPSWISFGAISGAFMINYIYLFVAFRLVKTHQQHTLDYPRCQRLFTLFLMLLIGLVGCTSMYFLTLFDLEHTLYTTFKNIFWLLIVSAGYYLIYQFIVKSHYLSTINPSQVKKHTHQPDIEATKERLERLMQCQKPFVRHSLTIYTLAEMLNQKPSHLSRVIHQCYKKNFSDYINAYRVKYFIEIVPLEEHRHRNLLGIALEIGFNSKNAFLRAFEKEYQTSPNIYFHDLEIALK